MEYGEGKGCARINRILWERFSPEQGVRQQMCGVLWLFSLFGINAQGMLVVLLLGTRMCLEMLLAEKSKDLQNLKRTVGCGEEEKCEPQSVKDENDRR